MQPPAGEVLAVPPAGEGPSVLRGVDQEVLALDPARLETGDDVGAEGDLALRRLVVGGVENEAAHVLDAVLGQKAHCAVRVEPVPLGRAGLDVGDGVRQRGQGPRGEADQLVVGVRAAGRTPGKRAVRLDDHHRVGLADGVGEPADVVAVGPLLLRGRQPFARVLLPRVHPEERHVHHHVGVAARGVGDVVTHLRGDLVVRDPVAEPLRLRLQRDLGQQPLRRSERSLVRRPRHLCGAPVDPPLVAGQGVAVAGPVDPGVCRTCHGERQQQGSGQESHDVTGHGATLSRGVGLRAGSTQE